MTIEKYLFPIVQSQRSTVSDAHCSLSLIKRGKSVKFCISTALSIEANIEVCPNEAILVDIQEDISQFPGMCYSHSWTFYLVMGHGFVSTNRLGLTLSCSYLKHSGQVPSETYLRCVHVNLIKSLCPYICGSECHQTI